MSSKASDPSGLQQQHLQEKKEAASRRRKQSGTAQLERKVGSTICRCFPELQTLWDSGSADTSSALEERLSDITAVLRYFYTHPRILESIRQGLLK